MNYFPIFTSRSHYLVGASAGVSAIVIGIATYIPNYQVKLPFLGFVKIWHIAAFNILLDLIQLAGNNGGGHFAHLGGALFGFLYVNYASNKEIDLFKNFNNLFRKKDKKSPLKTVYNSGKTRRPSSSLNKTENQKKVDEILDKIGKSGYDALSKEEKDFLFKQGKNN